MIRIHALAKTVTPLHIAAPANVRFNLETGAVNYGSLESAGGMPCTGIQKLPIAGIFECENGGKDSNGNGNSNGNAQFPVIAGNNIAGRLRRHAARLVLDALKARGEKVSLLTYSTLQCGAWTGSPDGEDMRYGEYVEAKKHPYMGLFGGGPRMMRKGFRTHNALPSVPQVREVLGSLAHPHGPGMPALSHKSMTKAWGFRRNDDLRDLVGIGQAAETVSDFEATFAARQEQIIQEASVRNEEEGGAKPSRTSTKTYTGIEFVIPGVTFEMAWELLDGLTKAQVGLFLASLASLAATEAFGGYCRNGFGLVNFVDVVLIDENDEEHAIFNNGALNKAEPYVAEALAAWNSEASTLSAERLEALCQPSERAAQNKAAKAEKKAAKAEATKAAKAAKAAAQVA